MVIEIATTKPRRFIVAISLTLLAASCGGGGGTGTEEGTPSPCVTVTPGQDGSPTPTPCPAVGAETGVVWKGTAPSIATSSRNPEAACQDSWSLEFTFEVSADGTIEGQGTADLTSEPTCNFPIDPVPWIDHHEYSVSGQETAGGFSIGFSGVRKLPTDGTEVAGMPSIYAEAGGQPVEIAVAGTSGTGEARWRIESGVVTLTANGTITLECVSC